MASPHLDDPHFDDLRFAVLDQDDDSEANLARLWEFADTWSQAFFEGRLDDGRRQRWLDAVRRDRAVLRAALAPSTLSGADAVVATYASWEGRINVGGSRCLPMQLISDVTVAPTHRRRGVLRRLMTDDLADVAQRGCPLVGLTASEGTIYGRFGFGVATRQRVVEVDISDRFALRRPPSGLRVELADPGPAYPVTLEIFDQVLASTRGAVSKPAGYEPAESGRIDWDGDGSDPDRTTRVALAFDTDDRARGFVRFTPRDLENERGGVAKIRDLQAVDTDAYLALWQFVAGLDLVRRAEDTIAVHDVLDLAVVDHEVITTKRQTDMLWLRVLDVPVALSARPWRDDASVVIEVDDPLGHAAGRWQVTTSSGTAEVAPTGDEPGVRLDAETLAALYLGDRTVTDLAAVGRITGPDVEVFATMADHAGPPPWCTTDF